MLLNRLIIEGLSGIFFYNCLIINYLYPVFLNWWSWGRINFKSTSYQTYVPSWVSLDAKAKRHTTPLYSWFIFLPCSLSEVEMNPEQLLSKNSLILSRSLSGVEMTCFILSLHWAQPKWIQGIFYHKLVASWVGHCAKSKWPALSSRFIERCRNEPRAMSIKKWSPPE